MKITKEQIQGMLYTFANTDIDKNSAEHNVLLELIKLHPKANEKIGSGIDYFFVQKSKWKFNQFNFMIKRTDGSTVDFSYQTCLNIGKRANPQKKENWSGVFRNIVKDQVDTFRDEAFKVIGVKDKFICSETKLKFKKYHSHVDHVYPLTFESILHEFITANKIDLTKVQLSEDTGTSEVKSILDKDLVNNFYEFHKNRAVLRVVCISANLQAKRAKYYNGQSPSEIKEELIKTYPQYHLI
jgi:hypothetical protein